MQRNDSNNALPDDQAALHQYGASIDASITWTINPLAMTPDKNWLLGELFRRNPGTLEFNDYCRLLSPFTIIFLEKGIYRYIPRRYPHELRYGVAGRYLGGGSFGSVYELTHRLKFAADGSLHCKEKSPDKKRVIKIFRTNPRDPLNIPAVQAANEADILSIIGTMNTRQVLSSRRGNLATLMMRYVEGESLKECVLRHQRGIARLTVVQRLMLSSMLCAALQNQVHPRVVHRDVKLDNAIVTKYPDENIKEVTFIDFNLSKRAERDDTGEGVGTARYAPPEAFFRQKSSLASDIYSMGRILWQLWDLDVDIFTHCTNDQMISYRTLNVNDGDKMTFLFAMTPDSSLAPNYKNQIKTMLLRANAIDMSERPTLNDIAALFDRIILEISTNQSQMNVSSLGQLDRMGMVNDEAVKQEIGVNQRKMDIVTRGQMDLMGMQQDDALPSMVRSPSSPHLFARRPLPRAVEPDKKRQATQCVLF